MPTTHDQKESGDIAGMADVVLSILGEPQNAETPEKFSVRLWLTKNRHGLKPRLSMLFHTKTLFFGEKDEKSGEDDLPI